MYFDNSNFCKAVIVLWNQKRNMLFSRIPKRVE